MLFRRILCLLSAAVVIGVTAACGGAVARVPIHHRAPAVATNLPPGGVVHDGADTVQMLHGGLATFVILTGLVDHARSRVEVEMYEFGRQDMVDALIRAHRRGVGVTVIIDPTVDVSAATETRLRGAGIDVVEYPVHPMMIDHVKLMIVDGVVGVVGGINWGAVSQFNHDVDAVVRGPVVTNLEHVFRSDLVTAGRQATIPDSVPDPAIHVATTLPGTDIRPLAISLIENAGHTLDLELYVITDTGIVADLIAAEARGVRVRVLLDPSERPSDGPAAALRAGGVDVRVYASSGELLHAKFVVADSRAVLFGSANWSKGGFERNHECDAEISDSPALAADFEAAVTADWNASAG